MPDAGPPGSNLQPVLASLAHGDTLAEAEAAFGVIMPGEATPAQIAGFLMALRVRGETVAELTGAARAMRARMLAVEAPAGAMDVCGAEIRLFAVLPEQAGLDRAPVAAIKGGGAEHNAAALLALLQEGAGPCRDTVALDAAAGPIVAGRATELRQAAAMARAMLDNGAALAILGRLREQTA